MNAENLVIIESEIVVNKGSIQFDLASVRASVGAIKELYSNWVVEEKDVDNAKKTITMLNKAEKALSDKRISVVKQFKEPSDAFEREVKDICLDINALASFIRKQTDEFDERTRAAKEKTIRALPSFRPFMTFNPSWLNKTTSFDSILKDIAMMQDACDADLEAIEKVAVQNGLDPVRYINMRLSESPVKVSDIAQRIVEDAETIARNARRQAENERIPGEENARNDEIPFVVEEQQTPAKPPLPGFDIGIDKTITTRKYSVVGAAYQLDALEVYISHVMGLTLIKQ